MILKKIAQVVLPVPNDDGRTYAYTDKDIPILGRLDQYLWKWKREFQDILQWMTSRKVLQNHIPKLPQSPGKYLLNLKGLEGFFKGFD